MKFKRILSLVLCLVMLFTLMPFGMITASAATDNVAIQLMVQNPDGSGYTQYGTIYRTAAAGSTYQVNSTDLAAFGLSGLCTNLENHTHSADCHVHTYECYGDKPTAATNEAITAFNNAAKDNSGFSIADNKVCIFAFNCRAIAASNRPYDGLYLHYSDGKWYRLNTINRRYLENWPDDISYWKSLGSYSQYTTSKTSYTCLTGTSHGLASYYDDVLKFTGTAVEFLPTMFCTKSYTDPTCKYKSAANHTHDGNCCYRVQNNTLPSATVPASGTVNIQVLVDRFYNIKLTGLPGGDQTISSVKYGDWKNLVTEAGADKLKKQFTLTLTDDIYGDLPTETLDAYPHWSDKNDMTFNGRLFTGAENDVPAYASDDLFNALCQVNDLGVTGYDKAALVSHYVYWGEAEHAANPLTRIIARGSVNGVYPKETVYANPVWVRNLTTTPGATAELHADFWTAECTLTAPAGDGFSGWKVTDATKGNVIGTKTVFAAGETIYVKGNVELEAQWNMEPQPLTLRFNNGTPSKIYMLECGESILDYVPTPQHDVYNFAGWFYKGQALGSTDLKMVVGGITLEAAWDISARNTAPYKIKLDPNGATRLKADNNLLTADTYVNGGSTIGFNEWVTLNNPFDYKYTVSFDPNGGQEVASQSVTYDFVGWGDKNPTYHATWTGWDSVWNIDGTDVNYGSTDPVKFNLQKFEVTDYDPVYYATQNGDVKNALSPEGYNKYVLLQHYVETHGNEKRLSQGNSSGELIYADGTMVSNLSTAPKASELDVKVVTLTAKWDDSVKKSVTLPTPTDASGRVFLGWYDENGQKVVTNPDGSYTPTKDVTLTAHWGNTVTYGLLGSDEGCEAVQIDNSYYFYTTDPEVDPSLIHPDPIAVNPINGRWIINGAEKGSGIDCAVKATPKSADGYRVEGWYVNGEKITDDSKYIVSTVAGWGSCTVWPKTQADGNGSYPITTLQAKFVKSEVVDLSYVLGFDGSVTLKLPDNVTVYGVNNSKFTGEYEYTFTSYKYSNATNPACDLEHGSAKVVDGTALYFSDPANPGIDTFYYCANIDGERVMTYENNTEEFKGTDKYCVTEFATIYRTAKVTVIPATEVYYDDSIGDIKYTGDWTVVSQDSAVDAAALAESLYGDPESCTNYYLGSAHKATVSAASPTGPSASFTFKGTGFDVISLTNNRCGTVLVAVDGKTYIINNYRGYSLRSVSGDGAFMKYVWTYSDGGVWHVKKEAVAERGENTAIPKTEDLVPGESTFTVYEENFVWTPDNKDPNASYYQIPILKFADLTYGEHTVTITPMYFATMDQTGQGQYDFYLDSIRVYDSMGDNGVALAEIEGHESETSPRYVSLRQQLLSNADYISGNITGIAYIDGVDVDTVSDYQAYGSGNEIYLQPGKTLAFAVDGSYDSVWLGFKALNGSVKVTVGTVGNNHEFETSSPVDYYRNITNYIGSDGTVTIMNSGDATVSLTTLKICGAPVMLLAPPAAVNAGSKMLRSVMMAKAPAPFEPTVSVDAPEAVTVGDKLTVKVTTSNDVAYITVNGVKVTEHDNFVWSYELTAEEIGTLDFEVMVFNDKDKAADNVQTASVTVNEKPFEPTVSVDAPEAVTVGDKVTVKVTTSNDVAYITVNGVKVETHDKNFVWTYELSAEEAGALEFEVKVFNGKDKAADNVQTASVTVNEKPVEPEPEPSVIEMIENVFTAIGNFLAGLFKGLFN